MSEVHMFIIGKKTEEFVFKANGITDLSDLQRVLDSVEKALSTDAEPVSVNLSVFVSYDGKIFATEYSAKDYCKDRKYALGGMGYSEEPLQGYLAPPAPSVAVNALEWETPTGANEYYANASSIVGQYRILPRAGFGFELLRLMADTFPFYSTVDEAKAAAQSDYEARIRSALSVQVQEEESGEDGEPSIYGSDMPMADISKLYPEEERLYAARKDRSQGGK